MIRFLAALAAAAAFVWPALAAEPGGPRAPVALELVNASRQATLRCQLVLAHFVTHDAALLPAGGQGTIELQRYLADGALGFVSGGRTMAVERLLCGADDAWATTARGLDLGPLRDGRLSRLSLSCGDEPAFTCGALAGPQ